MTGCEKIIGLSLHDGLTGLFNHTCFYQQIDLEVRRFVRYGTLLSLMMIDIDDFKQVFKQVNDSYGHREGERILASLGKTLLLKSRSSNVCCRYGGEEFAVILPLTDRQAAGIFANRLRTALRGRLPDGRTVTVSIGVASCGTTTRTHQTLVEKADAALYHAKRSGKDRVVIAEETDDAEKDHV